MQESKTSVQMHTFWLLTKFLNNQQEDHIPKLNWRIFVFITVIKTIACPKYYWAFSGINFSDFIEKCGWKENKISWDYLLIKLFRLQGKLELISYYLIILWEEGKTFQMDQRDPLI